MNPIMRRNCLRVKGAGWKQKTFTRLTSGQIPDAKMTFPKYVTFRRKKQLFSKLIQAPFDNSKSSTVCTCLICSL